MVADKMVRTKWYTDKMSLDKMARTKWYGQNGTNRTVPIKSSINLSIPFPLTNDFFINPASTWIPLHFLRVLSTICDFWLLISINFTLIVIYSKTCYHFVRTILSVPFCPYHFVQWHFVRIPFCPYHFVQWHFVRIPFCPYHFPQWHFVHIPFCPYHFVQWHFVRIPFCPYHFVQWHFVRIPFC